MPRKAIIPDDFRAAAEALDISPGILSGDHLFLTGTTGSGPEGEMPGDAETPFHNAFAKIGAVLEDAGLGFDAVVEMTKAFRI